MKTKAIWKFWVLVGVVVVSIASTGRWAYAGEVGEQRSYKCDQLYSDYDEVRSQEANPPAREIRSEEPETANSGA